MKSFVGKGALAVALVGAGLMVGTLSAAADDIAAAGNGGTADGSANGGAVALGDVTSGANVGNAVFIGDSWGDVWAGGGSVVNATAADIWLDGGVGISDASGGDENDAFQAGDDE